MRARALLVLFVLSVPFSSGRAAGFTEPPITFYGKVTNTHDGYSRLTTNGQLAWTIQPTSGPSFVLTTPLSALAGGYSYRLQVPVEKVPTGFTLSVATIPTTTASATYTRRPIMLDGAPVTILSPAGPTFGFAEKGRGKMRRVDLGVSKPFPDGDGDGLPGWWETLYGLDPLDPNDAAGDADGDGSPNAHEYDAGTNPLNPNDRLRITRVIESGGLEVTWTSVPGRKYRVHSAATPTGAYTPVSGVITARDGQTTKRYTHPTTPGEEHRFYKVVVVP